MQPQTYRIMIADPDGNVVDYWEVAHEGERGWVDPDNEEYGGIPTYGEIETSLNRHRELKKHGPSG